MASEMAHVLVEGALKIANGQFHRDLDKKDSQVEDLDVEIDSLTQHLKVVAEDAVDYYLDLEDF